MGYYYSSDDDFVEYDSNLAATNNRYKAFHDGLVTAGLTIPFAKHFTACPMIGYTFPLSGDADDLLTAESFDSEDSDFFFGGVTFSIAF